jgi:hypothetical protein
MRKSPLHKKVTLKIFSQMNKIKDKAENSFVL